MGITPTYGRVSRYGLIDYANSLDKIGALAKTTEDVALALSVISGQDKMDPTSIPQKAPDFTKYVNKTGDLKGIKIALPKEFFSNLDKKVEKNTRKAVETLESLGAVAKEVSLDMTKHASSAYYIIATAEASTNLARYCGMRYGQSENMNGHYNEAFSKTRGKYLTEESKRRILLGTFARMAGYRDHYYLKAMKIRTLIIEEYKRIFKRFDIVVGPTMPIIAPKFSEIEKLKPQDIYQMDTLTISPNIAGVPMLSVPCGTVDSMPTGMHIIADHMNEGKIINIGSAFEDSMKKI